jgi:hypothetical protein
LIHRYEEVQLALLGAALRTRDAEMGVDHRSD